MRAHFWSTVTNDTGALIPGTAIAMLVNQTDALVGVPVYSDGFTSNLLSNPWVTSDGTVDFYLDSPQRVDLQVTPPGQAAALWSDVDVQVSALTTVSLVFASGGSSSTAVGNGSSAAGSSAVAFGDTSSAAGNDAFAGGQSASASGTASTALGQDAAASAPSSTAVGRGASAAGTSSVALGTAASASVASSTALGVGATAGGTGATAIGQGASASGLNSTAVGAGATASADNQVVLGTAASTVVIPGTLDATSAIAFYGIFGNGQGGAVILDGTTTYPGLSLSGSSYTMQEGFLTNGPSSLTINSGVTLGTAGLPLLVDGPLVNNGTIANTGPNGSGSSPGGFAGNLMYAAFEGAAASVNAGAAASAAGSTAAGAGGAGGASPAKGSGGAGGTVASSSGTAAWRVPYAALAGVAVWGGAVTALGGGAGGGSGSGDGTNSGGAGGSGGGAVVVCAKSLANNGLITVAGGIGASPITGNAGGGGGGGGGTAVLITESTITGTGTVSVSGGAAGGGHGTGSSGSAGSSGQVIQELAA